MARNSSGSKNQPHYATSGAPDDAADLTEVSDYAAANGNRKVGLNADRLALSGADRWEGLEFYETDTRITWYYTADGWKPRPIVLFRGPINAQQTGVSGTLTLIWSSSPTVAVGSIMASSTQFTLPVGGLYRITVGLYTTGVVSRQALVSLNGATGNRIGAASGAAGAPSNLAVADIEQFSAGDVIRLQVLDAAAGLLVLAGSWASIELIG